MKLIVIGGAIVAFSLSGCIKGAEEASLGATHHGRYIGVGIYPAGRSQG